MRSRLFVAVGLVVSVVLVATAAGAAPAQPVDCGSPVPATETDETVRVVITYENATARASCGEQSVSAVGGTVLSGRDAAIAPVLVAEVDPASMATLEATPTVKSVTRDAVGGTPTGGVGAAQSATGSATAVQTVPWGIRRVNGTAAAAAVDETATGRVDVAVLDTGIDLDHPDIGDSVVWGADMTSDGAPRIGRQYTDDVDGHGTHVAGTLAAANNSEGVVGIAPNVSLYSMRVLRADRTGYYSWWVRGIELALDGPDGVRGTADDADVISMSLGGSETTPALERAIENAAETAVVVAASGNGGRGEVLYPAAYPETIAVGSTDRNDERSQFSATGPEIDIVAPGSAITSTYPSEFGRPYETISGTSMAAPHVAGAASLLIAQDLADGRRSLSPDTIAARLSGSAADVADPGRDDATGAGRLDAVAAVNGLNPRFRVETATPLVDSPVVLNATGTTAADGIARYTYSVGNTTLTSTENATTTVTLPEAGTVSLTLSVTDTAGRTATTTRTVTVRNPVTLDTPTAAGSVEADTPVVVTTTVDVADIVPEETVGGTLLAIVKRNGTTVGAKSMAVAEGERTPISMSVTPPENGTMTVSFSVRYTVAGTTYAVTSPQAAIEVPSQQVPTIAGATPTSLDGDPLLEDIDGDGRGTLFDALAYYNNRNSPAIVDSPRLFDFDGDGTSGTLFDAIALYRKVT